MIAPSELSDQHLFSEFREIKIIPASLRRSINARGIMGVYKIIPSAYTLGKGHVSFFYNKGQYLIDRYDQLRCELTRRGVNFNVDSVLDPNNVYNYYECFRGTYTPTDAALQIIRERIAEKIAMKPNWYRWTSTVPPVSLGASAIAYQQNAHGVLKLKLEGIL